VQKNRGEKAKLTEAEIGRNCGGKWPAARSCGGEDRVLAGRDVAGTLRAPGHRGSSCGGLVKASGGLEESEDHRRPRIAGVGHLTGVGFGSNSGVGGARGLMQKPWTAP
jgi:hypothetical protein